MPAQPSFLCLVCGDKSGGQHFGAEVCRACAAFFRRTIARKMKYICRYDDNCEVNKALRCMCRSCRLKKCYRVGMNPNVVQSPRVPAQPPSARPQRRVSSESCEKAKSIEAQPLRSRHHSVADGYAASVAPPPTSVPLQIEQPLITYETSEVSSTTTHIEYWGDVHSPASSAESADAKNVVINILMKKDDTLAFTPCPTARPTLTRLLLAYKRLVERRDAAYFSETTEFLNEYLYLARKRTYHEVPSINLSTWMKMNRMEIEMIADMVTADDCFRNIPTHDKMIIFKNFWISFLVFERTFETYRVLGTELHDPRMVMCSGEIIDVDKVHYDVPPELSDMSGAQLHGMIRPWTRFCNRTMMNPVKQLEPSEEELMFVSGIMLWSVPEAETAHLSPETHQIAKEMVRRLYDELFHYYKFECKMDNYVYRVSELMKLISLTERTVESRKDDIMLTKMFNIFKLDIFMAELFQ
ncbi:hypothetical protein QR680_017813 [Steinernema hermaphroditum]|uniref:Nuclear receptor domain-containing protein n=1 Tax=Steinernema hermaphroditum TaxID=289476 RepID=A0AA39HI00_9BILA|nr:hypothetical protein QR680_017813 [Steinernema hermaphroditum]